MSWNDCIFWPTKLNKVAGVRELLFEVRNGGG